MWSRSDGFIDLGTLNGESNATAVNHHGSVVGYFIRLEGGFGTFLWTRRTDMRDVTPATMASAFPVGIDDEGRIAVVDDPREPTRSAVLIPRKR